jgi:hypothetical protein
MLCVVMGCAGCHHRIFRSLALRCGRYSYDYGNDDDDDDDDDDEDDLDSNNRFIRMKTPKKDQPNPKSFSIYTLLLLRQTSTDRITRGWYNWLIFNNS